MQPIVERKISHSAARRSLTVEQGLTCLLAVCAFSAFLNSAREMTLTIVVLVLQLGFFATALWRLVLIVAAPVRSAPTALHADADLPSYSVLVALLDEAGVIEQLVERLSNIDYPADKLEGFLILEAHDHETIDAAWHADRPTWLHVLVAPPGFPRTKPRALNHALSVANGDLVTVYDAEDEPDPLQLREAAARFAADRTGDLVALQAPLRVRLPGRTTSPFLDRQFAAEYAGLFELTLPALARLGLPFPLGGTSNHFRVDRLRRVGGWDAFNVTEDADLGFRLWRDGGRSGVLTRPTIEPPPGALDTWLPQRTRWLKGFMQTFGVHSRSLDGLGLRGLLSLVMTIGVSVLAAAAHAPSVAWFMDVLLMSATDQRTPPVPLFALFIFAAGAFAAWMTLIEGSRRAGIRYGLLDILCAPAYWSLLTLAFGHALWRLVWEPFAWDKTRHHPDAVEIVPSSPSAPATGRQAA